MSGNSFKNAVRNIIKGKVYSVINICGLAMGLSACLLIALFVTDEFSYDHYNEKADRIFIVVAILILLIACVNFMNLATARSADRSREVGVRKVLGASRKNLIAGFLSEAVLTSLIALALAIVITALLPGQLNPPPAIQLIA